jgi:hypothetical protein
MLTFKSFLSENSLLDLRLELWLQRRFKLSKDQRAVMAEWLRSEEIMVPNDIFEILLDNYRDHVSYTEVKDGDADDIFLYLVMVELKAAGIEVFRE